MIKVAIVEDQAEIRNNWCQWLNETPGFVCVASAGSTAEAIVVLPQAPEGIDVVLLDISLGEKDNGVETLRHLRPLLAAHTQYMMFTIHQDDDTLIEAVRAGATGYILKDTDPGKVVEAIWELHEGGSPMSMGMARKLMVYLRTQDKPNLNPQENRILVLIAEGKQYKIIESILGFTSISAVKKVIRGIYLKMGVGNRTEAVNRFRGA